MQQAKDHQRTVWVKGGYSLYRGRVTGPDGYDYPIENQPGFTGFEVLDAA